MKRRALATYLVALAIAGLPALAFAPQTQGAAPRSERLLEDVKPGTTLLSRAETDGELRILLSELLAEAEANGSVDIVVKTAVAFAPEVLLSPYEQTVQRREIANAAKRLLGEFPRNALGGGTEFVASVDKPYVSLTVTEAELRILENARDLVRITRKANFNWQRDFVQLRVAVRTGLSGFSEGN